MRYSTYNNRYSIKSVQSRQRTVNIITTPLGFYAVITAKVVVNGMFSVTSERTFAMQ